MWAKGIIKSLFVVACTDTYKKLMTGNNMFIVSVIV